MRELERATEKYLRKEGERGVRGKNNNFIDRELTGNDEQIKEMDFEERRGEPKIAECKGEKEEVERTTGLAGG